MSPEANNQPTQDEAPEGLITSMPKELETEELLEAGEQEPLLEAGDPKIVDASDIPAGDETAIEPVSEAVQEQPNTPMNEHGGYTNKVTPTPEQAEENIRLMREVAGPGASDESDVGPVRPYVKQ